MFDELSQVVGPELGQDCNQWKDPQKNAKQQEFESVKIVFTHATTDQPKMHHLLLDAYPTIPAMKPLPCFDDFPLVFKALLTQLAIVFLLLKSYAGIDESGGNPGDIKVDEDEDREVVEGKRYGVVR